MTFLTLCDIVLHSGSYVKYLPVIASGGISSKEDIDRLREIGVEGCIVGKALYEGKIKLAEVV